MINIKNSKLSKEEILEVKRILSEIPDYFNDFYYTKENLRLFIKDNCDIVIKNIEKGDYLIYDTEEKGLAFVLGFSDSYERKYIKLIGTDSSIISQLLATAILHIREDLYIKINNNNPIINNLLSLGFEFFHGRGRESLYIRRKQC